MRSTGSFLSHNWHPSMTGLFKTCKFAVFKRRFRIRSLSLLVHQTLVFLYFFSVALLQNALIAVYLPLKILLDGTHTVLIMHLSDYWRVIVIDWCSACRYALFLLLGSSLLWIALSLLRHFIVLLTVSIALRCLFGVLRGFWLIFLLAIAFIDVRIQLTSHSFCQLPNLILNTRLKGLCILHFISYTATWLKHLTLASNEVSICYAVSTASIWFILMHPTVLNLCIGYIVVVWGLPPGTFDLFRLHDILFLCFIKVLTRW